MRRAPAVIGIVLLAGCTARPADVPDRHAVGPDAAGLVLPAWVRVPDWARPFELKPLGPADDQARNAIALDVRVLIIEGRAVPMGVLEHLPRIDPPIVPRHKVLRVIDAAAAEPGISMLTAPRTVVYEGQTAWISAWGAPGTTSSPTRIVFFAGWPVIERDTCCFSFSLQGVMPLADAEADGAFSDGRAPRLAPWTLEGEPVLRSGECLYHIDRPGDSDRTLIVLVQLAHVLAFDGEGDRPTSPAVGSPAHE
jgi:hypothetical protein